MNAKIKSWIYPLLPVLFLTFQSCENESNDQETTQATEGKVHHLTIDETPFLKPNVENFKSKNSLTSKSSGDKEAELELDVKHIIEYDGADNFKSYSIPVIDNSVDNSDYYFENLHVIKDGDKYENIIIRYTPTNHKKKFALKNFTGKMEFFNNNKTIKRTIHFVNGKAVKADPIPNNKTTGKSGVTAILADRMTEDDCNCGPRGGGGNFLADFFSWVGGLFSNISISSGYGSASNTGYVLTVTSPNMGSGYIAGSTTTSGSGTPYVVFVPSEPEAAYLRMQVTDIVRKLGNIDSTAFAWMLDYRNANNVNNIYNALNEEEENSSERLAFLRQAIITLKSGTYLDLTYSEKSPMNVDLTNIFTNSSLPENRKFIDIYNALITSPEFKKLFIDLFGDSKMYNVKFEVAEHVYENNDPTKKEVNATTSQDPITKNFTIKINKQILITGTSKSQTKIENAKTILHECIHAYLFVKANNPSAGADFVKVLNTMYPTVKEQHDFMYGRMIPTMQKVLGEIRDLVTTGSKRAILETQYTMHPTITPLTSTSWIWLEYYKYISINGLEEASCFKVDFPINSNQFNLFTKYIEYGRKELDR